MTKRFEPGDRVVVVRRDRSFGGPQEGAVGTVLSTRHSGAIEPWHTIMDMKIEWDNKFSGGHSCGGLCQNGHGWNFMYSHIGDLIDLYEETAAEIDLSDMETLL